ncbi:MAG: glycosyltransferase family 2 protein [Desulfuromonadales bacterium]
MTESEPTISACIVTYNQAPYIERCVRSLLDQREGKALEILISDDASTDGTREIVKQLAEKYPDHIKSFLQDSNLGGSQNYYFIHRQAKGQYIIHMDGDDFALPGKLDAQIEYLEKHPECTAVIHKVEFWDADGARVGRLYPDKFRCSQYDLRDLVLDHPVFLHSALMYRGGGLDSLFAHGPMSFVDCYIYVHLASQGRFGVIDKVLGGYTQGIGVGTKLNLVYLVVEALEYARELGLSQRDYEIKLSEQYFTFAQKAFVDNNEVLFRSLICQSVDTHIFSFQQVFLYLLRWFTGLISVVRITKKWLIRRSY